jgi:hypothetical protein
MNYTYENNSASIEYLPVVLCEIPKEVYSNPKGLTEEFLINNGYCSFVNTDKWNASEVSNVQRVEVEENQDEGVTYWDISTLPEAQGNLFQGECVFWDSNLDLGECPEDLKVTDTAFEYKFFEACTNGKVSVCLNNNYVAGLDRQGKAPLKLVAFYDANKYGSQYQWKEFEI